MVDGKVEGLPCIIFGSLCKFWELAAHLEKFLEYCWSFGIKRKKKNNFFIKNLRMSKKSSTFAA